MVPLAVSANEPEPMEEVLSVKVVLLVNATLLAPLLL